MFLNKILLSVILISPCSVSAVEEQEQDNASICSSSDVVPFTAFFECCASHIWTIFAPSIIAIGYGWLRVRSIWDRRNGHGADESFDFSSCPGLRTVLVFIVSFISIFVDLLAAAANFKANGSDAVRCFAVGSCLHSAGIVAAEFYRNDGALEIAVLCIMVGQILELVSFLYINQWTRNAVFIMIVMLGGAILLYIHTYQQTPTETRQKYLHVKVTREDYFKQVMGLNQVTLAIVVIVAFLSTLKGSYLLLLLPVVPVETIAICFCY